MATDGKITVTLNGGGNEINVAVPIFGYQTIIDFPFTIVKRDDGSYNVWDDNGTGSTFDKRYCQCQFELSASDMNTLNTYISDTGRGQSDLVLSMSTGSGFFPFGPDKGDTGDFEIALVIKNSDRVSNEPWGYFVCEVEIYNTGTWPSYTLPSEVSEGSFTFGTVTNCRFPISWFKPTTKYAVHDTRDYDGDIRYIDRGSSGDHYTTDWTWVCNESKAAAILDYIETTARGTAFSITSASGFYPFGRDNGDGSFTVKMIQERIVVRHENYDQYKFDMKLCKDS